MFICIKEAFFACANSNVWQFNECSGHFHYEIIKMTVFLSTNALALLISAANTQHAGHVNLIKFVLHSNQSALFCNNSNLLPHNFSIIPYHWRQLFTIPFQLAYALSSSLLIQHNHYPYSPHKLFRFKEHCVS